MFRRSVSFSCSNNDCRIASRISASISSDTPPSAKVSSCGSCLSTTMCPPPPFKGPTGGGGGAFASTSWSNSSSCSMYSKLSVMIRYPGGNMIPAKSDSILGSIQKASPVFVAKTSRSPKADALEINACTPSDLAGKGNEMAGTTLASSTFQICSVSVNSFGPFCATPTTNRPISSVGDITTSLLLSSSFNQSL